MKRMLLGNEALALGAYMSGVSVATGYPGTPSTEILEYFANYPGVYAEWSPNEKVALEVGVGAAMAGARTIVTMKHVGLNVAADPFFAVAYTGTEAGLVVISADDPGMHSSQGEQDNRNYAKFAKVPLLEPSDSQECADMMRLGLEISEQFDTPVLVRTTTRVSHAQSLVEVAAEQLQHGSEGRPGAAEPRAFNRNPAKYVMLPSNARQRRLALEERLGRLQEYVETTPLNYAIWGDRRLGIVTSSIATVYAREVFPTASFLKLGMAYPLPRRLILDFARQVDTLLVVEELDPYLEEQIRALLSRDVACNVSTGRGVRVLGKDVLPAIGEFTPELVAKCALDFGPPIAEFVSEAFASRPAARAPESGIPQRPPLLCPGCGHRGTFYTLRQLMFPEQRDGDRDRDRDRDREMEERDQRAATPSASLSLSPSSISRTPARSPYVRANLERRKQYGLVVTGDIGCYTLGSLQPLFAMDTCACMGASIGQAIGLEKGGIKNKIVAVIGDSTFYHSGITGLVDVITSGAATTVIILDNFTTAMTGGNVNPGTGKTVDGKPARRVELETLCRGLGIEDVVVINGFDTPGIERELVRALQSPEPSVLIVREPCVLEYKSSSTQTSWVEPDKCVSCWACLVTACPALIRQHGKVAVIPERCTDCQVCNRICPHDAILRVERDAVKA
jgi:indolepyruvate ferredoxin oxidoreductase alpha subunit